MASQLNIVYAYSWHLPSSNPDNVRMIMESIRAFCIELGCEDVSEVFVQPDPIGFTAVVPNAGQHAFSMASSHDDNSWNASSWLRVSSFKEISRVMFHAATQGIEVRTMFGGMELCYRKNALGVIEFEQRPAFDPDTF